MSGGLRRLAALLLLATNGSGGIAAEHRTAPPAVDYFPLHEHDLWRYRSTTAKGATSEFLVTVVGVDQRDQKDGAKPFQVQTLVEGKRVLDWYAKPKGWVVQVGQFPMGAAQRAEFTPPKRALKNPARVGDRWTWKGTVGGAPVEMAAEVVDEGEVSVPAGTFHTIHVVTRTTQAKKTITRMQWYASGVGMVRAEVDMDGRRAATELVEYQVHK